MSSSDHKKDNLPPGKRPRTTGDDSQCDDDLISKLPEELISEIISRLSTQDAVRTSALSRNWKDKWTFSYNIEISDKMEYFRQKNGNASFTDMVTSLLRRTQNSRIKNFSLTCIRKCQFSHIETWVSDVLTRNVQYLEIIVVDVQGPWCFSGWNLLTELTLEISCTLKVPDNNCFPCLKLLWLDCSRVKGGGINVMTSKVSDTGSVTLYFPVLQVLLLSHCKWLDVKSLKIQAPELICAFIHYPDKITSPKIEICGPKLVLFRLSHAPIENIVLNTPAVTFLALQSPLLEAASEVSLHKLLKTCPNLKYLKLSGTQVLLNLKPRLGFPTFDHLKELVIRYGCDIKDVMESVQVFPHLESLFLNVKSLEEYEFRNISVPKVFSRLKEVILVNFTETKSQHDLARYLLENARNLEEMSVNLLKTIMTVDRVEEVVQSLSKLKPKSSRCKIVVEHEPPRLVPKVTVGRDGNPTRIEYRQRFLI